MNSMSQTRIILDKLKKEKQISNQWAFENGVWRLGARIHELRQIGYEIVTVYKNEKGHRNTKYRLVEA